MILQRLRLCLGLILLCLGFSAAELAVYHLTQIPIAESLQLAGPGPLAIEPHNLLDRLNEWRSQTPQLGGMIQRLVGSSLLWTLLKYFGFSWGVFALYSPHQARALGLRALRAMFVQALVLALPRLLLYAGIVVCAQGLMSADPFVPWALLALLWLLSMLQVSCDLAMIRALSAGPNSASSPKHAAAALSAWVKAPGTMLPAWLLRIAQIAFAAGPMYEQATQTPGPSDPRSVVAFVAASFLLWALRLWMLAISSRYDLDSAISRIGPAAAQD